MIDKSFPYFFTKLSNESSFIIKLRLSIIITFKLNKKMTNIVLLMIIKVKIKNINMLTTYYFYYVNKKESHNDNLHQSNQ
ncbi:hypothetical protein Hdeb2414_s0022g00610941 [Helianthus debilis subsp. tardiflorus]